MSRNCKVNEFDINTQVYGWQHLGGGGEGGKIKLLVVLEIIIVTMCIVHSNNLYSIVIIMSNCKLTLGKQSWCSPALKQSPIVAPRPPWTTHWGTIVNMEPYVIKTPTSLNNDKQSPIAIEEQYVIKPPLDCLIWGTIWGSFPSTRLIIVVTIVIKITFWLREILRSWDWSRSKREKIANAWTENMKCMNVIHEFEALPKPNKNQMTMKITWNVSAGRGVHMIVIRRPDRQTCVTQLWIPKNTSFIAGASLCKWGGGQGERSRDRCQRNEKTLHIKIFCRGIYIDF